MTVYIITRSRYHNLIKIIPRWIDQSIPIVLVTERSEKDEHEQFLIDHSWSVYARVISPSGVDKGVGHARRVAINHAHRQGHKSVIMSDDDVRPSTGSDMRLILQEAAENDVLGVGAVRHLHARFSKGATTNPKNNGVILCPGGWGMQLFALNVSNTISVGNFDSRLDCFGEDHELMRNGISGGIPWLVHCGAKCEAIGSRYEPGGLNAFIRGSSESDVLFDESEARALREVECRKIIYGRWPNYVSHPDARPRMAWQRMLDDYIIGWRRLSAIHGGKWSYGSLP